MYTGYDWEQSSSALPACSNLLRPNTLAPPMRNRLGPVPCPGSRVRLAFESQPGPGNLMMACINNFNFPILATPYIYGSWVPFRLLSI